MEITIENLSKNYGNKIALNNLSLNISSGMFGLLGANGAGKTTFMRILSTTLRKTSGTIKIDGKTVKDINELRKYIGYLPQEFSFYPNFTVYEIMDYFSALSKIKKNNHKNIIELLEKVNLLDNKKSKIHTLSGGMKRRLGIATALINKPNILLVDEPTVGLDPEERIKFRNLLTDFASNRIVILSTHIISDIEETCEKLAILKKGNLVFHGTTKDLIKTSEGMVWEVNIKKDNISDILKDDKEKFIISQVPIDNYVKFRIIAKTKPYDNAILLQPKLEDSYIRIINEI